MFYECSYSSSEVMLLKKIFAISGPLYLSTNSEHILTVVCNVTISEWITRPFFLFQKPVPTSSRNNSHFIFFLFWFLPQFFLVLAFLSVYLFYSYFLPLPLNIPVMMLLIYSLWTTISVDKISCSHFHWLLTLLWKKIWPCSFITSSIDLAINSFCFVLSRHNTLVM